MQSSKGCARLRNALKCIGMHLGGHCYSRIELLTSKGAEKTTVASAADHLISKVFNPELLHWKPDA